MAMYIPDSTAMITPSAVANYFLDVSQRSGIALTPLKLMKLVYIAYAWYYAAFNRPLFDEKPEAWPYGPVFPSLYHEFKRYGKKPIGQPSYEVDIDTGAKSIPFIPPQDTRLAKLLALVWATYKNDEAHALVDLLHEDGSPWKHARDNHLPVLDAEIIKKRGKEGLENALKKAQAE